MPPEAETIENPAGTTDPASTSTSTTAASPPIAAGTSPETGPSGGSNNTWAMEQLQARVAKLTAKNKELEARASAGTATPGEVTLNAQNQEEIINTRATAKALEIAANTRAQDKYNQECADLVSQGKTKFGDEIFNKKIEEIKKLWDPNDREVMGKYTSLIQASIDSGEGAKLLFLMADDLSETQKIMNMSTGKMAAALAKLVLKDPPQELSEAPKPMTAIGSRGRTHEEIKPSDKARGASLDSRTWHMRREKEVEAYNKQFGRRVI